MERLPNYQNFEQLYNLFTTEGGMKPAHAAGVLGNIYAESRGNPGAINPGDGALGGDSVGILQWNEGRAAGLRSFAKERGVMADNFLEQGRYLLDEIKTTERGNYAKAINTNDPGQAALGFAKHVVRPAAQHIPQREQYGQMMYDIFAGGNPNGVQAGLAYSPEQAERLSRQTPENTAKETFDVSAEMFKQFGNPKAQKIVEDLFALANPDLGPEPPMTGPRQAMADAASPQVPNVPSLETAPNVGERPAKPSLPSREELDAAFPAPAGETKTTELIDATMAPVAEASAYKLGVPVEDAPKTTQEAVNALAAEEPAEDDDSEEAERKRRRRLVAADMLTVLSQGLGQMAAGQGVDVSGTINNQRNRYAEQLAQQQAQEQQQQQAQAVAQELTQMGMPGMARIAMSGPDGLKTAMQTAATVKSRKPAAAGAMESLSAEQRAELLMAQGADARSAAAVAPFADLSKDLYTQLVMPDPEAEAAAAEEAARQQELNALAEVGSKYSDNPAVRTAATSAFNNPTVDNVKNLRNALQEVGASEAELAATAAAEQAKKRPLTEEEAKFYARYATPEQIDFAMTEEGAEAADAIRNAGTEGLEAGAERQAQADVEATIKPDQVRFFEELNGNAEAMNAALRLRRAQAGTEGFDPIESEMAGELVAAHNSRLSGLRTRAPMVSAMRDLVGQLSAPEIDRTSGGPLDRALSIVTNVGKQLGVEILEDEDDTNYLVRLTDSLQGEFFQNFRLEGSGATSDKEAENFMNAMPRVGDSVIKQLGLAQRLIRLNEREELAATLEQEYITKHSDNADKLLDRRAKAEFIANGVAAEAKALYPRVDLSAADGQQKLIDDLNSGNITPETVVRYVEKDGTAKYMMYQDIINLRSQQ